MGGPEAAVGATAGAGAEGGVAVGVGVEEPRPVASLSSAGSKGEGTVSKQVLNV